MKILHIIRNPNDATPLEIARAQSKDNEAAILLLHDAVYAKPDLKTYACAKDAEARGVTEHDCVDYGRIAEMLFEYDKVVSW
jgi:sulfur transfer complex TusBCD TusB component (DsrH family)